jgi:hypothetical protein
MANVDFKVTAWERIVMDDEDLPKVLEKLNSGEITSSNELYEFLGDKCLYEGLIDDTTEQMSTSENDNQSTIEVIKDTETIYTNA